MTRHLNPIEQQQVADLLMKRQKALGISMSEVARRAGVDPSTVHRLHRCNNPNPSIDSLTAIARALEIPVADILALSSVLPDGQLPSFTPYLRAKYADMPDSAIAEMQSYFDYIVRKHHVSPDGPRPGEDE